MVIQQTPPKRRLIINDRWSSIGVLESTRKKLETFRNKRKLDSLDAAITTLLGD